MMILKTKPWDRGTLLSFGLHGFVALALWTGPSLSPPRLDPQDTVEIEVTTIDKVARTVKQAAPSKKAAPRETREGGGNKGEEKTPPPQSSDRTAPAAPRAAGQGERLDTRSLASLIDKSLEKADRRPKKFDAFAKKLERDLPQHAELSPAEAATLVQYMQARITQCFSMPSGAEALDTMQVTLKIVLEQNGQVIGVPEVTEEQGRTTSNSGFFRAFVESTKRAILRCQPYALPAASYAAWREQEIIFNPRDLTR